MNKLLTFRHLRRKNQPENSLNRTIFIIFCSIPVISHWNPIFFSFQNSNCVFLRHWAFSEDKSRRICQFRTIAHFRTIWDKMNLLEKTVIARFFFIGNLIGNFWMIETGSLESSCSVYKFRTISHVSITAHFRPIRLFGP